MKKVFIFIQLFIYTIVVAQEPNKQFSEKEVPVNSKNCMLYGSLMSPIDKKDHSMIAIIIAGSGPTDRDGNNKFGVTANSYKMLAESLAKYGIASFRYDKRGMAKSVVPNFKEEDLVFEDYIFDLKNIYDYFHDSLGFKNIYFIGHSEGSLIGMIAAQTKHVQGYISLSGAGRTIDTIIDEQIKAQPSFVKEKVDSIFIQLKKGENANNVPPYLLSLFRPSVQPYMISWLKYNPAREIGNMKCRALIIQGTCDIQVKTLDAENLKENCKTCKLDLIPQMTHTLKNAGENCIDEGQKTYKDPNLPLNSQLVNDITSFILQH